MKIESYAVNTSAQRSYTKLEAESAQVSLWGRQGVVQSGEAVSLSLSDLAREMIEQGRENGGKKLAHVYSNQPVEGASVLPTTKEELKMRILETLFQSFSGRRVSARIAPFFSQQGRQGMLGRAIPLQGNAFRQTTVGEVRIQQMQYEHEAVSYQAQGVIKTADGQTLNVDLSMQMSRTFYSSTSARLGIVGKPVDPLVINYGGTAASLSGETFSFDLDMDGKLDNIAFAGAGSGFLALDVNGDGKINDGGELFGPQSGSGFGELRAYDTDGNGWIDENDDVFGKLLVWSRDASGKDQLFKLKDLGIGAIYLGDTKTEFAMKDAANNTQGIMRSTSFFLREDGSAGTVNHIDLMA